MVVSFFQTFTYTAITYYLALYFQVWPPTDYSIVPKLIVMNPSGGDGSQCPGGRSVNAHVFSNMRCPFGTNIDIPGTTLSSQMAHHFWVRADRAGFWYALMLSLSVQ